MEKTNQTTKDVLHMMNTSSNQLDSRIISQEFLAAKVLNRTWASAQQPAINVDSEDEDVNVSNYIIEPYKITF